MANVKVIDESLIMERLKRTELDVNKIAIQNKNMEILPLNTSVLLFN